jgi:hypothetical protein
MPTMMRAMPTMMRAMPTITMTLMILETSIIHTFYSY